MMRRIISIAVLGFMLFAACQSEKSGNQGDKTKQQDKAKTSQNEKPKELSHQPLEASDLELGLDEGTKLAVDSITKHHLQRMNTYISKNARKMENLSSSSYKKLKADLTHEIRKIEENSNLSGKAAKKRDQLLDHAKSQLEVMEQGDRQASHVALLNLNKIMEKFGDHFK